MPKETSHIIILGPQGSGKGTQAKILAERLSLYHLETGKIFRKIAKQKTPLGKAVDRLINKKGKLVPFSIVVKILKNELKKIKKTRGMVFDGFPRNLEQAKVLEKILHFLGRKITHVVFLPINRKTTVKRLSLRRTCVKCNRIFIYGIDVKTPQSLCPVCGGRLVQRADDQPAAIAKRLEIYEKQTKPVVDFYKKKGLLIKINGEPPIPQVAREIKKYFSR